MTTSGIKVPNKRHISSAEYSIYGESRIRAGIRQKDAAVILNISVKQLSRYESLNEGVYPTSDMVRDMARLYNDSYLMYEHVKETDSCATEIISGNVPNVDIQTANTMLELAIDELDGYKRFMKRATLNRRIDEDETLTWINAKRALVAVVQAAVALDLADGLEL